MDRSGNVVPTFPKAHHFVQRTCWEDACKTTNERCSVRQHMKNFLPIAERGQLVILDGNREIFPGLNVIVTNGHAEGHQMVMFNHGGERVVFLGDLVPTPHHLNPAVISAFDHSPQDTFEQKREILADAKRQGWLLVFSHGHETKAGYLEQPGRHHLSAPGEVLSSMSTSRGSTRRGKTGDPITETTARSNTSAKMREPTNHCHHH